MTTIKRAPVKSYFLACPRNEVYYYLQEAVNELLSHDPDISIDDMLLSVTEGEHALAFFDMHPLDEDPETHQHHEEVRAQVLAGDCLVVAGYSPDMPGRVVIRLNEEPQA